MFAFAISQYFGEENNFGEEPVNGKVTKAEAS